MEKELGMAITQDELFKATHLRKKKMSTNEDTWVEPRAQATYEKYMRKVEELRSQGVTPSQEQLVELWKGCAGDLVKGTVCGLPGKIFQEKDHSLYCAPSFGIDSAARASLEERIDTRYQQIQSQLDMLLQSGVVNSIVS